MKKILLFLIACVVVSFTASATPSWEINSRGAIQWNVDKAQLPHKDHVEMSGEQMAFVLRWAINADGALDLDRSLVFPMLRTIPNDTHASLMHRLNTDITSMVSVEEKSLYNEVTKFVEIDGMFRLAGLLKASSEFVLQD